MNFNEYQQFTRTTAIYPEQHKFNYLVSGLAAEAGEVAGKWAKHLRDTSEDSHIHLHDALIKELGDVLWFVARLSDELGEDLNKVVAVNVEKLTSRMNRGTIKGSGDER